MNILESSQNKLQGKGLKQHMKKSMVVVSASVLVCVVCTLTAYFLGMLTATDAKALSIKHNTETQTVSPAKSSPFGVKNSVVNIIELSEAAQHQDSQELGFREYALYTKGTQAIDTLDVRVPEYPSTLPKAMPDVIQKGESASVLLQGYLGASQIKALSLACMDVYPLKQLRAGKPFVIKTRKGEFTGFEYEINSNEKLVITKSDSGFDVRRERQAYEVAVDRVQGDITVSLFGALTSQGERAELAMKLADIFAWEVDFFRDLRAGDSFKAVVEKHYRKGELVGYGRILAAEFVNQGRMHQGFFYQDKEGRNGYYDAQGNSMRKAFLKAPLAFTRISSGYTMRRLHPIKHVYRAHPAIDYAAPTGTPVKAVGDATVLSAGWNNGGGKTIKLRHPNGYVTMYLHLSRYARGIKKGAKVDQGQIIGYVGSTGMSTGPHLDFRMKKNGAWVNPTKIKNPQAVALSPEQMNGFKRNVDVRKVWLEQKEFSVSQNTTEDGAELYASLAQ